MSDVLRRIAAEFRDAQRPVNDRAYDRLREAIAEGNEIGLSDHELVLAISRALWHHELATAQLGLTELEIRTAANTRYAYEDREAA